MSQESLPTFDGYETIELLGEGASSKVYLVSDDSGNKFAVKALREELAGDESLKALLESEAKSLLKINHPRVSRFVSFTMDSDPLPHLVTEYVEGKTLKDLVSESPLSGPILLSMSKGLLEGLQAIHEVGIIHKDLKPGNIVFTEQGVKLIDFGISENSEGTISTADDNLAATPGWLSPEQANGKPLTPASDIFNFGMVLAYASSGKHPFGEGTQDALLFRIANGKPSLEAIPNWLKVIVNSCLDKDPLKRPTFEQLSAWLNRPGSSAPDSTPADSTTLVSGTVLSGAARAESSGVESNNFSYKDFQKPKQPRTKKSRESSGLGWKSITAIVASVALIAGFFVALTLPGRGMVVVRVLDNAQNLNEVVGQGSVVVEGPGWSEEVEFFGYRVQTLKGEWISNREISVTYNPSFSRDERYEETFYPEDFGANILGTGQKLILEFSLFEEETVFNAKIFRLEGVIPRLSVAIESRLDRENENLARRETAAARVACADREEENLQIALASSLGAEKAIDKAISDANLEVLGDGETYLYYTTWQYRFRILRDGIDDLLSSMILEEPSFLDPIYPSWAELYDHVKEFREATESLRYAAAIESDSRWDDDDTWDKFYDSRRFAESDARELSGKLRQPAIAICERQIPMPQ